MAGRPAQYAIAQPQIEARAHSDRTAALTREGRVALGEGALRVDYSDVGFVSRFGAILNLEELFSEARKRAGTARKTSN